MWQMTHETDGVREREVPSLGGARLAHGRVEGGEERIVDQNPRTGEPVQQARLSGIGVAGQRDGGNTRAPTRLALGSARSLHGPQLSPDLRHVRSDSSPVGFDFGLTRTAGTHAACRATGTPTGLS